LSSGHAEHGAAAEPATHAEPGAGAQRQQIIHGDYGPTNLILTSTGLRIIDFGECGHGTIEFDIGNTFYMALFDAWHQNKPERYQNFRRWFLDAYDNPAAAEPTPTEHGPTEPPPTEQAPTDQMRIDEAIETRARALQAWLDDPASAPTGIRTASPQWHRQLRRFLSELRNQ
jgi:thiamine kinase-like enzyme